ncbi:unnamed protein product [Caenorhabditis auriculariae]|uniref:SKI-interacting protein SKIP SNW domain-containing protein n=1 Tax=Caenorhabditis auriculariae TaxID=2777116 RepID=A0A8S1HHX5_9PELO|nr:unnamed protein product [Caenorhabditis auriculariae]
MSSEESPVHEFFSEFKFLFQKERLKTYNRFIFDKKPGARCTSAKLAEAGFRFTGSKKEPSLAQCCFCEKEMHFEIEDDPWQEHIDHTKNCPFVKLNKLDENEWTLQDALALVSVASSLSAANAMEYDGKVLTDSNTDLQELIRKAVQESSPAPTMSLKLKELLPAPVGGDEAAAQIRRDPWFRGREEAVPSMALVSREPPPYGKRQSFKPRAPEDFGDGGAFPEIHMAQFPLGMGLGDKPGGKGQNQIALQYGADGKLQHDAIARIGHGKDKVVYSKLADMKSKTWNEDDEDIQRPDEEAVIDETEKTRLALEKIVNSKVESALPVRHADKQAPAQYIRYTPSQQSGLGAGGSQQRIIRMVEEQKDPMEPPKFKINQKIPRAPPSPPAPVMHSPPRKVTAKDQNDWKIPPCISNWKNPKGFTVALDKRLAADGRGLQQTHINENFAKLADALYIADRKAREAVEARAQLERRVAQNKKAEQEEKMRQMAAKARQERAGNRKRDEDEDDQVKAREEIRRDRLDDIRKERNIARSRPDKLDRLRREKDRDISEKIVLGLPDANKRTGEPQFDQRLFDQSKGLDSGAMDEDTYNPYDKAWRGGDNVQQHIYRPSKNIDKDIYGDDLDKIMSQKRFVPDKGFSGAEGSSRGAGPVQFEKDQDVFGLSDLFQQTKEKKRGADGDERAGDSKRSKHRD